MSDELRIKDCRYKCEEVGKNIKASKLKHLWEFKIDGVSHTVELYESRFTNKRKILADKKVILQQQ